MKKFIKKVAPVVNEKEDPAKLGLAILRQNAMQTRADLMSLLSDPRRDMDKECGYPTVLTPAHCAKMIERDGIAARVVNVWPDECWLENPCVYEQEKPAGTEFETTFAEFESRLHIFNYLHRIDRLSGIGRFGVLLLGFADGKDLAEPVESYVDFKIGEKKTGRKKPLGLAYLRVYPESAVTVSAWETDKTSPRYGLPTFYNVQYQEDTETFSARVHWHRIIHVADNRSTSEVYGEPRLQLLYNRTHDIQKVAGGSGEMFWRGAFPGIAFEVNPDSDAVLDKESTRLEFEKYSNGLQRYLALSGVSAKSLGVQLADPTNHMETLLNLIAIALSIPRRVLFGSEQAQLASEQDARAWTKRVRARQTGYLTHYVIRPLVERLISVGVLPTPKDIIVSWPDMLTQSTGEKASAAKLWVEAFAAYVNGGVAELIPPLEFFTFFSDLKPDQIEALQKQWEKMMREAAEENEDENLETPADGTDVTPEAEEPAPDDENALSE